MRNLISVAVVFFCILFLAPSAVAGPNEGGTLIIHAMSWYDIPPECTGDSFDFCGDCVTLDSCDEAVTSFDGTEIAVIPVFAAFPEGSSPRVSGLTFGIEYDESTVFLVGLESCADFELPEDGWPSSGTGTAITFSEPRTGELEQVYWFAAYEYYQTSTQFALTPHPNQGGYFGDDSVPSLLDPIADFGRLGFNMEGHLPCPDVPVPTIDESWGVIKRHFRD